MLSTPFDGLHKNLGANFDNYCGFSLPADYGNPAAESAALYQHCCAFDLSAFARIAVSGSDAPALIHSLFVSRTDNLESGSWTWAIAPDTCGSLLDIVRLCKIKASYLILASPRSRKKLLEIIKSITDQNGLSDLKIIDNTEKTGMLALYGPAAVNAFRNIVPIDIEELELGNCLSISLFMMPITVVRGSFLSLDGIELIAPAAACKLAASAIEKYHKKENITPAGMECLEAALTEASLPIMLTDQPLPQRLPPAAYGLAALLDPKKPQSDCQPTRQLVGLKLQGNAHQHRDLTVQYGGLEIGWTDRVVYSHKLNCAYSLAMVDQELADLSEEVQLTAPNFTMPAEIVPLPLDPTLTPPLLHQ